MKLNVLIITPAPTETAPQFTDDLFNKFRDFTPFKIHNIEGSKEISSIVLDENNIFVMSKQLLQKYTKDNTIKVIKKLKLDIIGFDENHFSGTTDLSKDILKFTDFLDRYCYSLGLNEEQSETIKKFTHKVYTKKILSKNTPESMLCGCIFFVSIRSS